MGILKEHIVQMEKDQLNSHQTELTSFFLIALDFRAQHGQVMSIHLPRSQTHTHTPVQSPDLCHCVLTCVALLLQGELEKAQEIEGFVIDCLLAMVMKLSEVTFRPLFFKVRRFLAGARTHLSLVLG